MTVEEARQDFITYIENTYAQDLLTIDDWIHKNNLRGTPRLFIKKQNSEFFSKVDIPIRKAIRYLKLQGFEIEEHDTYITIKW